jgi:hypothetical protein
MGLDIMIQTVKGDDGSWAQVYRIGYGSYGRLMDEIARFFQIQLSDTYYCLKDDDWPETDLTKLTEFENEYQFKLYKLIVQNAEDKKVLLPLLMHSDCDGSIPVELLRDMLPLLKTDEITLFFKLNSEWEEEFFSLVRAIETAVSLGCDFIYS